MNVERKRPIKQFRVIQAFGPYRKGDVVQPTGMYRDVLAKRGLIEEVQDAPPAVVNRMLTPAIEPPRKLISLPKRK